MRFEWDKGKAQANLAKHGLDFRTAALVFRDPHILTVLDKRYEGIEERWISLGLVGFQVIYVAHTVREDRNGEEIIRIISARKATPREERSYYLQRES
jgi:uncharacterized DUF497 family protein